MAINDIIKLKGESAIVIAEVTVAAGEARGIVVVIAKLLASDMFVVVRNGFVQLHDSMENATLDIRKAYGEFSRCVEKAVIVGR